MEEKKMKKVIVIGIIALFIGVSFQSAVAIENKLSSGNIKTMKDFENKGSSESDFIMIDDMFSELKDFTNSILTRFGHIPEVKEKCQVLLDIINEYNSRPICEVVENIEGFEKPLIETSI